MSTTNHTTNYELSQYIGSDVTSYLSNYNSDMYKIDAQMKINADDAAEAKSDASAAVSAASAAASNASAAVSAANAANTTAGAAQTAATAAQTAAGAAQTDAAAALRASASNTIGNLAPAYDPTLTYDVDDLVTYVDPETNQGKLYKCIIAVVSPEAFNINKWDDVTTSEVYTLVSTIVASHTKVSGESIGDAMNTLMNGVILDANSEYLLVHKYGGTIVFAHSQSIDNNTVIFQDINIAPTSMTINQYGLKTTGNSYARQIVISSNSTSVTDITNDTFGYDSVTLYKINTI